MRGRLPGEGHADDCFAYAFKTRGTVPAWAIAAMVAVTFFTLVGYAKLSGHWDTKLPKHVFLQLVPVASEQRHPTLSG